MQQRGSVFVLASDGAARDLIAMLRTFHWTVCAFDSLAALLDGLQAQMVDVLVLQGSWPDVAERVVSLGRAVPAAALVWRVRGGVTVERRIAALDAGVDVCVEAGMPGPEWDALLRSLCRRGRRGGSPWRVDLQAGALAGPAGQRVPLTAAECAFLVRLLNAPGHRLPREALLPEEVRGSQVGMRRVDVLVSRLRAKARRLNVEFPVLAVRGWGYMLLPDGS